MPFQLSHQIQMMHFLRFYILASKIAAIQLCDGVTAENSSNCFTIYFNCKKISAHLHARTSQTRKRSRHYANRTLCVCAATEWIIIQSPAALSRRQWNRLISSRDLRDAMRGLICFYLERTPLGCSGVLLVARQIETTETHDVQIVHCTRTCGNCCTESAVRRHYSLSLSRPEIRPHSFAPNRRERNFKSDECHRSHYCKYTDLYVFAAQWSEGDMLFW
jgi:hypothetical protein